MYKQYQHTCARLVKSGQYDKNIAEAVEMKHGLECRYYLRIANMHPRSYVWVHENGRDSHARGTTITAACDALKSQPDTIVTFVQAREME